MELFDMASMWEAQKEPFKTGCIQETQYLIKSVCEELPSFCNICKLFFHTASRCPQKDVCLKCGKSGHKSRVCDMMSEERSNSSAIDVDAAPVVETSVDSPTNCTLCYSDEISETFPIDQVANPTSPLSSEEKADMSEVLGMESLGHASKEPFDIDIDIMQLKREAPHAPDVPYPNLYVKTPESDTLSCVRHLL